MKKTVNFRFSEETLTLLQSLAERWCLTRTATVERLVYDAAYEESLTVERGPASPMPVEDQRALLKAATQKTALFTDDRKKGAGTGIVKNEPKILPNDPKEVAKVVEKDTRTPEQKRDDFYRSNMAKGKK